MDLEPGTVVASRYRITHPLGKGGMGEVFAAENVRTGRHVAVKLLRADSKTKSSAIERFRREARAAGSINSDHVTQVLDVEEDAEHGIVLVFELLEGESLIDRLKRTGPIPFDELFGIIEQVWMGLADAHMVGIIHRDLKPSNVFLERRPDGQMRVKILDFGISKLPKEMGGETLTEMGQSLGTFSFMPPEQIGKAKTVDHRADIYACATLIYQALSGQLPYLARNILVMVELKAKTDPRSLSEVMDRPADPRLEAFLKRGLAREPSDRFQSAVDALTTWRELRPLQPIPISSAPSTQAAAASTSTPSHTPPSAMPRSAPASHSPSAVNSPRPSYTPAVTATPQSYGQHGAGQAAPEHNQERRPRGGTIAMETTFESSAPTQPMQAAQGAQQGGQAVPQSGQHDPTRLRPVSPSVFPNQPTRDAPRSGIQDPRSPAITPNVAAASYQQDPRSAQGPYGSSSYPPPPSHGQGPYSGQGYPPPPLQHQQQQQPGPHNIYNEDSKLPPPSQAQTRVYTPNNQGGLGYNAGSAPMTHAPSVPPSGAQSGTPTSAPMTPMTAPRSSSLRVVLWFIAFAVVGFGIVATLHYLAVF